MAEGVKRRRDWRKGPKVRPAVSRCAAPVRSPQRRLGEQPSADPWPTLSTPYWTVPFWWQGRGRPPHPAARRRPAAAAPVPPEAPGSPGTGPFAPTACTPSDPVLRTDVLSAWSRGLCQAEARDGLGRVGVGRLQWLARRSFYALAPTRHCVEASSWQCRLKLDTALTSQRDLLMEEKPLHQGDTPIQCEHPDS